MNSLLVLGCSNFASTWQQLRMICAYFNALEEFKDSKAFAVFAESNWNRLLCVQLVICWCIVLVQMFWRVQVAFSVYCGEFLTIHFNLITIRDELLPCCGRRRRYYTSACLFCFALSNSFKLGEPWIPISDSILWREILQGLLFLSGFRRSFRRGEWEMKILSNR